MYCNVMVLMVLNCRWNPFRCVRGMPMATSSGHWKLGQGAAKCLVLLMILHARVAPGEYEIPEEALPTRSGYLDVKTDTASSLFYTYYEALDAADELSKTPIVLWLQVSKSFCRLGIIPPQGSFS